VYTYWDEWKYCCINSEYNCTRRKRRYISEFSHK
jgi:hypothetical protein